MPAYRTISAPVPQGWLRWLARVPIWLYRLGLGWLFGDRLLLLTHIGRHSGRLRHVVLEVIGHEPDSDTYFVASGFGHRAAWFRNIQATPHVLIAVGRRRIEARATTLTASAAVDVFVEYARRHPTAFRRLSPLLVGQTLHGTKADCRLLAEQVPLVALRPFEA